MKRNDGLRKMHIRYEGEWRDGDNSGKGLMEWAKQGAIRGQFVKRVCHGNGSTALRKMVYHMKAIGATAHLMTEH